MTRPAANHPAFRHRTRSSRVLRSACAWMLVVLAALPFTAPFSAISLPTILASTTGEAASPSPTRDAGAHAHVGLPGDATTGDMLDEAFNDAVVVDSGVEFFTPVTTAEAPAADLRTSAPLTTHFPLRL